MWIVPVAFTVVSPVPLLKTPLVFTFKAPVLELAAPMVAVAAPLSVSVEPAPVTVSVPVFPTALSAISRLVPVTAAPLWTFISPLVPRRPTNRH
jgi:hypothetical protein